MLQQTLLNTPRNTSYPDIPDVTRRAPVAVDLSHDEEDSNHARAELRSIQWHAALLVVIAAAIGNN